MWFCGCAWEFGFVPRIYDRIRPVGIPEGAAVELFLELVAILCPTKSKKPISISGMNGLGFGNGDITGATATHCFIPDQQRG